MERQWKSFRNSCDCSGGQPDIPSGRYKEDLKTGLLVL